MNLCDAYIQNYRLFISGLSDIYHAECRFRSESGHSGTFRVWTDISAGASDANI